MIEQELLRKIIQEVGLEINTQEYLVDQDLDEIIIYNNTPLRFTLNTVFLMPITSTDVIFNPIRDIEIAKFILSYYMTKLCYMYNRHFTFTGTYKDMNHCFVAEVKEQVHGITHIIKSDPYNIQNLAYIDLIFKLTDDSLNLSTFDTYMALIEDARVINNDSYR